MSDKQTLTYLAELLDAGITPLEACIRLENICADDKKAIRVIHRHLLLKRTLASAIYHAGYSSRLEYEIILIAESSGKLGNALRFVSNNLLKRQQRVKQLRGRLVLPNATFIIMLLINTFILMTKQVEWPSILFTTAVAIIAMTSITQLLLLSARCDASHWLWLGWKIGLHHFSKLFRRYFEYIFFCLFYWQIEAGIDYLSGSKGLKRLIKAQSYQDIVAKYQQLISAGNSVAHSLLAANLIRTRELQQIVITGEESGRFSQTLQQYLINERKRLASATDSIFIWLPRIYYFIVMFYAVKIIL